MMSFQKTPFVPSNYLPHIDGLRGLSVLFVFLFHLFPGAFLGGFLGVDIFFVVSGYLISKNIFEQLDQGNFSFFDFYARRVRRIYPALIVTCVLCLGYGFLIMFPEEFSALGKQIRNAVVFISNFTLYKQGGYFDLDAQSNPLLHLWSLAVEEQFYLLWPLFLWCFYRLWEGHQKIKSVLLWIGVLIAVSFASYAFFQKTQSKLVFYMMPFRFWELGVGAFWGRMVMDKQVNQALGLLFEKRLFGIRIFDSCVLWGCLFFLFISLFFLSSETQSFPVLSVIPVVCAGVLLAFIGKRGDKSSAIRVLSFPVLVGLGRISYPLYLFHWPFICFYKMVYGPKISVVEGLCIMGSASLLSYGVYVWIESPIRRRPIGLWIWSLVGVFMLVGGVGWLAYKRTFSSLVSTTVPQMKAIESAINDWDYPPKNAKEIKYQGETFYQIGKGVPTLMFVGDSNAEQYGPRIDRLVSSVPGASAVMMATWGGGVPVPGVGRDARECAFFGKVLDFIEKRDIKTVVLSAQWTGYFSGNCQHFYKNGRLSEALILKEVLLDFEKFIRKMAARGVQVYILSSMPSGLVYDPKSSLERTFWGKWVFKSTEEKAEIWFQRSAHTHKILSDIAKKTGAVFVRTDEKLCSGKYCMAWQNGVPLYKDGGHLRASYVRMQSTFLDRLLLPQKNTHVPL